MYTGWAKFRGSLESGSRNWARKICVVSNFSKPRGSSSIFLEMPVAEAFMYLGPNQADSLRGTSTNNTHENTIEINAQPNRKPSIPGICWTTRSGGMKPSWGTPDEPRAALALTFDFSNPAPGKLGPGVVSVSRLIRNSITPASVM